jgi:predicted nucleotidyltransferase
MDMDRDAVIATLAARLPYLAAAYGVRDLALFGSVARGAARPESDVDILVGFDGPATSRRYFGVQFDLEDHLGRPVDLVTSKALRPELRHGVEREMIRV